MGMDHNPPAAPEPGWRVFLLLPILHFASVKLTFLTAVSPENVVVIWLPNAVLLAALLRFRGRRAGMMACLTVASDCLGNLPEYPAAEGFLLSLCNLIEVVIGYWLMRRLGMSPELQRIRDFGKFVVAGPVVGAFCGSLLAAATLRLFGDASTPLATVTLLWWCSDGLGDLIYTPLLLSFATRGEPTPRPGWLDAAVLTVSVLLAGLIFSGESARLFADVSLSPTLLLPSILFIAVRFGVQRTALAVGVVAIAAAWAQTTGHKPFGEASPHAVILSAQEFILTLGIVGMGFATLLAEQRALARTLEVRVVERTDQYRVALDEAQSATRAKSRFMAVVSHEVRTPLNGLLGMLQMLDPEQLDARQRRYLQIAEDSGQTLRSLIDSILNFERLDAEGEVLTIEEADLHRLITHAVEPAGPQASAKDLALELALSPDLPRFVRADPVRLTRVLLNLVGNAVKFTPEGTVRVEARFEPPCLVVAVADTGIGIAPDMHTAIFDDFVQADDSIARRFGGTGLGLAICRRIVERMGGSLTVESVLGAGSTFQLRVPVTPCASAPALAPDRNWPTGLSLSVLVVDDEAVNREVAAGLLDRLGHRATLADSAESGLALAAAAAFDAVLMDLHMPGLDGIAATQRLRALADPARAAVRVLAMTADVTGESTRRAAAAGMDMVVSKPLALNALRRALDGTGEPAAAPALAADGLIDLGFLQMEHETLGLARMIRVGRIFHRASRSMLASLDAAAAIGDRATIAAQAHRLRSAAGAMGLARLCAATGALEHAAATAPAAELVAMVHALPRLRRDSLTALAAAARAG